MSETKSSQMPESEQSGQGEKLLSILDVAWGVKPPEPLLDDGADLAARISSGNPYDTWKADPTPANLYAVTKSLKPTIDSVLASLGGTGSPDVATRARVVAAKAIQSYDPAYGASLPTWVSQQLRQLTRDVRKSNNTISIPEGVQLDGFTLKQAEQQFVDEHDREPTVNELADMTGLSVKRITDVRNKLKPVATEGAFTDEEGNVGIVGSLPDFDQEAVDYVYNDSDLIDRQILEMKLGYGGHDVLDNAAIMQKLGLTPVQLSRRVNRLTMRIQDNVNNLNAVQGM